MTCKTRASRHQQKAAICETRGRPIFVSIFGTENHDLRWFGSLLFSIESLFFIFTHFSFFVENSVFHPKVSNQISDHWLVQTGVQAANLHKGWNVTNESYRRYVRPIVVLVKSFIWSIFFDFLVSFSAENKDQFSHLFRFLTENEFYFRCHFRFRPKNCHAKTVYGRPLYETPLQQHYSSSAAILENSNCDISEADHPINSLLGSRVWFSGSADGMALIPLDQIQEVCRKKTMREE